MDLQAPIRPMQPYLLTGERILWSGRPKQGLSLNSRDGLLIPFSMVWGGFAIFWNASVWGLTGDNFAAPVFFRLWGLPFLIVGLYLILGRFIHDSHIRKGLCYAVTDQRVLILRGSKLTSLDIHRLPRLELSEHRDRTGTLSFEATNLAAWNGMNGFSWWTPSLAGAAQFFRIADARRVYEIIQTQARP